MKFNEKHIVRLNSMRYIVIIQEGILMLKKLVILAVTAIIVILCFVIYRRIKFRPKGHAMTPPEWISKNILTQMVSEMEPDTESCIQKYGAYFTENGLKQALNDKTLLFFYSLLEETDSAGISGAFTPEKVLENENGVQIHTLLELHLIDFKNSVAEKVYNADMRFIFQNGQWLIDHFTISKNI